MKRRNCVMELDVFEFKGLPTADDVGYDIDLQNALCLMVLNGDPPPRQLDLFYCNPSEIGRKK